MAWWEQAPPAVSPNSLGSDMPTTQIPYSDYQLALLQAQRAQNLATALRQQSFQPIESYESGVLKSPISWTQGLAKMLQAYAANKGEERSMQNLAQASNLQRQMYQGMFGAPTEGGISPESALSAPPSANAPQPGLRVPIGQTPQSMASMMQTNPQLASSLIQAYNKPSEQSLLAMERGYQPGTPGYQSAIEQKLNPPMSGHEGAPVYRMNPQTGQMDIAAFTPKMDVGMMPTPQGIQVAPGYPQARTQLNFVPSPEMIEKDAVFYEKTGRHLYPGMGQPTPSTPGQPSRAPATGYAPPISPEQQRAIATKRVEEQPKDLTSLEDIHAKADQAIDAAKSVLQAPGLNWASGKTWWMGSIPGTSAYNATQKLETLKSQIMLSVLQSFRSASSTGSSGFGQLSNVEGETLRNSIANLNRAQTTDELKNSLQNIISTLEGSKERMRRGYTRLYGEEPVIKTYHTNPSTQRTKTIGGKTYIQQNDQWYEQ